MNALSQVSGQGVATGPQIFALKKAMQANAEATMTLLQGVEQSSAQIQASNPSHLGQSVDVRA